MSVSSAGSSVATPQRVLACRLCTRRKVKCDRNSPCSNCVKANAVCTASSPAPARKRRRPTAELQARLARCEELLQEYASAAKAESPESPEDRKTVLPSRVMASVDPKSNWQPGGKLLQEEGGVSFTDNFLWATLYEELRAMRQIMETDGVSSSGEAPREPTATSSTTTPTPDNYEDLFLGADTPGSSIDDLRPAPSQIFRLWQVFLDRVHPLTKVIHVPTLQPYLVEAASNSQNIPRHMEALLFSIYSLAVMSLHEDECVEMLRCSAKEAFQRFSTGARKSLVSGQFLKSHSLVTLQALILHLLAFQGRHNAHAGWIMNGICIRMAQKMGIHRDGELLGLSPFETEMRRRAWWQIVVLDAKYSLMSGLSHSLMPRSYDCKMPKNLNDADFHPGTKMHLQDREGPTEMVFCLLVYKMAEFILQRNYLEGVLMRGEMNALSYYPISEDELNEHEELVLELEGNLNQVLERFSDPSAGPTHELALEMKAAMGMRMRDMSRPPHKQPEWGTEIRTPKDNLFRISITSTEQSTIQYLRMNQRDFHWFTKSFFHLDLFIYMVGQLCHRTSGSLVERAWTQIPLVYHHHPDLFDITLELNETLARFVLNAWGLRRGFLCTRFGRVPETPDYVKKLQEVMPAEENSANDVAAAAAAAAAVTTTTRAATAATSTSTSASAAVTVGATQMPLDTPTQILRPQQTETEMPWEQFFPEYFSASNLGFDMRAIPEQPEFPEFPEELLTSFGGHGIGPSSGPSSKW